MASNNDDLAAKVRQFCKLAEKVARARFDFPKVASDCFCPGGMPDESDDWHFEHDRRIFAYIEAAVFAQIELDAVADVTAEAMRGAS